jgi:hypothetical protein
MKSPFYKSKEKVEQDYARNAIADYKSGDKKAAKYEKKKELEVAAGESGVMMKGSAIKNLNKGYGSELGKSPLNMGGSWMSKHVKK